MLMTQPPDHQKSIRPLRNRQSPPRFLFLFSALVWSLTMIGMGIWHYSSTRAAFIKTAETAARYSIQKDITYRQWATNHGGVYVPVTEQTPPNPYLSHLPERDILTPSGRALTLVNPAYMTRQVHEIANATFGSKGKITSLKPLRPQNAPDAWEEQVLKSFAAGVQETTTFAHIDKTLYLRLMQPFITVEGCLKCHAHQGYKVGDVRGGISVAIPWEPYQKALVSTFSGLALVYSSTWLAGLVFIGLHRRKINEFLLLRQEIEQKEAQSLRHFQEIFNGVNDAIFLHDLESGKILDVNACTEREYGYSKQEIKQLSIKDISADVQPYTALEAASWMAKARQGECPTFEWRARHKDGHLFWVEVSMRKAHLLNQPVLLASVRNTDERKYAEQQAHLYMQRLSKLAAQIPGMIYQYRLNADGSACIPYASHGINYLFGVDPESVFADASSIFTKVHPQDLDTFVASIQESARELSVWHHQFRVRLAAGDFLWAEAIATPERLADGGTLWHGYAYNISDRKIAEELLSKQQHELQQRNTELERFNYTVSHDLKTPLVTIETFLGFLSEDLVSRDQIAIDKDIAHIRGATRQMALLLDSLLHLARISHNDMPRQTCSFQSIVKQALAQVAGPLTARAVRVDLADTDASVYGHPAQLIEIWQNLIENAVKYMGDQPQPQIDIGFTVADPDVIFFVRDNGIGIESGFIDKVFGLFNQLDKNAPGSGLGLALVKQIVEQNNGRIWLESAGANQGCCFFFTLPVPVAGDGE